MSSLVQPFTPIAESGLSDFSIQSQGSNLER
jgi:hypothetical protein